MPAPAESLVGRTAQSGDVEKRTPNGSHRSGRGPVGPIEQACGGETPHQIDGVHRVVDLDPPWERDLVGLADDLGCHQNAGRNHLIVRRSLLADDR